MPEFFMKYKREKTQGILRFGDSKADIAPVQTKMKFPKSNQRKTVLPPSAQQGGA